MTRLLDKSELQALLKVNANTINNMVNDGRLPLPIEIGRVKRWNSDVIQQWINDGCPKREDVSNGVET